MELIHAKKKPRLGEDNGLSFQTIPQRPTRSMGVRISNLPEAISPRSLTLFLSSRLGNQINVVDCLMPRDFRYARVTLASENQANMVLSLHGTCFEGHELQIQPWESEFRYANSFDYTTISVADSPFSSNTNHPLGTMSASCYSHENSSNVRFGCQFNVNMEECAIFVRNIPSGVSADDLKLFLQKRIQLAFKELIAEIQVVTCHLFKGGNQAFVEFLHRRHAIRALSLKNKTLQGQSLDILQWENRRSHTLSPHDEDGLIQEQNIGILQPTALASRDYAPFAVYINHLPENTDDKTLKSHLMEMMNVAYKQAPTIVACSVRSSPQNDAYVEFQSQEQVNQAISLRNRSLGGKRLNIIPWDPTFKILESNNISSEVHKNDTEKSFTVPMATNPAIKNVPPKPQEERDSPVVTVPPLQTTYLVDNENQDPTKVYPKQILQDAEHEGKVCEDPRIVNIFKRQLEALRLDRDHWKSAHDQFQSDLRRVTAELASTRAKIELEDRLDSEDTREEVESLRKKLSDSEWRFNNVATSLSQQTNVLNTIIQENQSLKAQLTEERKRKE